MLTNLKKKAVEQLVKAQLFANACVKKLKDNSGNGELAGTMILVLVAVVVGGILLTLFNDTVKSMWQTIGSKIADMFNYS